MQYSQEHLKTMVYAEFGGQAECIMGNWKIENISFAPGSQLYLERPPPDRYLGGGERESLSGNVIFFGN